jgi:hypothetical protein
MDPALKAELLRGLVQAGSTAVGAGVALFLGWRILRIQEQVKREEELRASMRRLRVDALVRTLEALGRYHNAKERRISLGDLPLPKDSPFRSSEKTEMEALSGVIDALAQEQFLLGPQSRYLSDCLDGMQRAGSQSDLGAEVAILHKTLERWIPPLEPLTKGVDSPRFRPYVRPGVSGSPPAA